MKDMMEMTPLPIRDKFSVETVSARAYDAGPDGFVVCHVIRPTGLVGHVQGTSFYHMPTAQSAMQLAAALSQMPAKPKAATLEDMILPCDVKLPPVTTIRKGVPLSTLVNALKMRVGTDAGFVGSTSGDERFRVSSTHDGILWPADKNADKVDLPSSWQHDGMVSVVDHKGNLLGCMGINKWEESLAANKKST